MGKDVIDDGPTLDKSTEGWGLRLVRGQGNIGMHDPSPVIRLMVVAAAEIPADRRETALLVNFMVMVLSVNEIGFCLVSDP